MSTAISIGSLKSKEFVCADLRWSTTGVHSINSRHEGIPGYDDQKAAKANIFVCGAGGLGGEIVEGGVRKGWGRIMVCDGQTVELSNLNRQKFTAADIGRNKAICLAKNLQGEGFMGTRVVAVPAFFQDLLASTGDLSADAVICGVDNDEARIAVARFCLQSGIPAIYTAVSRDTGYGYVFVQEPDGACFGCLKPEAIGNEIHPCPGVPATKDILKTVSGIVLYAVDTLIMSRARNWNYREIQLAGFLPDESLRIEKRETCRLCSSATANDNGQQQE